MAGFLEEYRSEFLASPDEHSMTGLLKNTAEMAVAGTAGRYVYYKFAGNFINNLTGKFFGKYANIGGSLIYSVLGQIVATKFVEDEKLSRLVQLAANVPLSDYVAKALGDPLGSAMPSGSSGSGDSQESQEEAYVDQLMSGGAPSVSMASMRGYGGE